MRSTTGILGLVCLLVLLGAAPACTPAVRPPVDGYVQLPYQVLADEGFSRAQPAWQADLKPFLLRLERYYLEQAGLQLVFKGYGSWPASPCSLDLPPQYCPFFRREQCSDTLTLAFADTAETKVARGMAIPLCGRAYFGPQVYRALTRGPGPAGALSPPPPGTAGTGPPGEGPESAALAYELVSRALGAVSEPPPAGETPSVVAAGKGAAAPPPALGPVSRRLLQRVWKGPMDLRGRLALAEQEMTASMEEMVPPPTSMLRDFGELLYWRGSDALAERVFLKLIEADEDKPEYRGRLAEVLQRRGKLHEALANYNEAARWYEEKAPGEGATSSSAGLPPIYANRGACLTELGALDDAAESFGKALALKPEFVEALYGMGYVSTLRGDQEAALGYYQGAVERMPDHRFALNGRAATLLQLERYEEAMVAFRDMLEHYPQDGEARYGLGVVYHHMGKKAEALENYQKALEIKPDYAECLNNLAQIYLTGGGGVRPDEHRALKLAQRAVNLSRGANPHIWDTLALVLAKMKKYEGAMAAVQRARSLDPTNQRLRTHWEEIQKKFLTDPDFGDPLF